MTETFTLPLAQRSVADFIEDVSKLTIEIQELYCSDSIPWILGVSWGKDSSTILQLVWNAVATLPSEKRKKKVYVITTDTQVENPIVSNWVRRCIEQIKTQAELLISYNNNLNSQ
jgi:DNA sulfur modification protein DndC